MMNQFVVQYRPGGMSLDHSSWWLAEVKLVDGIYVAVPIKFLKRSDYK